MYVVIGANGYIGSYVVKNILEQTNDEVLAVGRNIAWNSLNNRVQCMRCDITNQGDIERLNNRIACMPKVKVLYLASYHHPDDVKKHVKRAWNTNVTSLSQVLNTLDNVGSLFYISTEMVYGEGHTGKKFTEKDGLHPVNLYGIQKKTAESVVLGYGYHVVRFPFVIGPSLLPDKKHFYDVIVDTVKSGREIEMFADVYKTALDFNTAANLLVRLCGKHAQEVPAVLNICGDDILSKYEIALEIVKKHQLDPELVKPVGWKNGRMGFSETRANCTLLDNSLLKQVLQVQRIQMKF